jgi:hypothetical protein
MDDMAIQWSKSAGNFISCLHNKKKKKKKKKKKALYIE